MKENLLLVLQILGTVLGGLGIFLLGMKHLSEGLQATAGSGLRKFMAHATSHRLVGVGTGVLSTIIVQSSSIITVMLVGFVSTALMTLPQAINVLIGANIGTTATGWIAAIGGTADAKRTALSHTLSNLVGSVVLLPFFPLFVKAGQALFPNYGAVETIVVSGQATQAFTHMMAPIAVTDTLFACCRGLIFFPVARPFCRLIERIVKQPENEKPHLSCLKVGTLMSPVIACDQALQEVNFMKESDLELLACARKVIAGESDEADENHITHREDILDTVQKEVTDFLGSVMSKRLSWDVAERARRLLRLTDELESVSDEVAAVLKAVKRLRKQNQRISDVSLQVILSVHDRVAAFAAQVTPWIRSPRPTIDIDQVQNESKDLHEFIRECRHTQLGRVGPEDPGSSVRVLVELDIINAYERVRAYYLNIAETLAGRKR